MKDKYKVLKVIKGLMFKVGDILTVSDSYDIPSVRTNGIVGVLVPSSIATLEACGFLKLIDHKELVGCACYRDMKTDKLVIVSNGKSVPYCDGYVINVKDGVVYTKSGVYKESQISYSYELEAVEII